MASSKSDFDEKSQCAGALKVCGTCARVYFNLSKQETQLLEELLKRFSPQLLQKWTAEGQVYAPSGARLDPDKTRAAQLLQKHRIRCWAPSAMGCTVTWADQACFMWLPILESPTYIPKPCT
jgi:hypothetical protein